MMGYATDSSGLQQQARDIDCPYCGEEIEILLDPSVESQQYIEDCQVCCRPITMKIEVDYTDPEYPVFNVQALHENEY